MTIYLHIGAGKCGSSALQTALTKNPVITDRSGNKYNYTVINKIGEVCFGNDIKVNAATEYKSSSYASQLLKLTDERIKALGEELSAIDNPILSCEGWLNAHRDMKIFLEKLGLNVEIIAYVRPQIEYINSAWWQWEAWVEHGEKDWIAKRINNSKYADSIELWQNIPEVKKVTTRLLPKDIVPDFLEIFDCEASKLIPIEKVNTSLPAVVLRLFQRHSDLRDQHDGQFERDLSLFMRTGTLKPPPWIISPALARRIVKKTYLSNQKLLTQLDEASAETMRNDPRWWSIEPYAHKKHEPLHETKIDVEELEKLTEALVKGIKLWSKRQK